MDEQEIKEQVQVLRDALEAARGKLLEQGELLERLTTPPLGFATVVARGAPAQPTGAVLADALRVKGARVRLREDSEFADQTRSEGSVEDPHYDEGWVYVVFDDGYKDAYRIGLPEVDGGIADLELVDPLPTLIIVAEGKYLEVLSPPDLEVKLGSVVRIVAETAQVIDVASVAIGGNIGVVRQVIDALFTEVDYEASPRVVFTGEHENPLEKGDRVILDGSGSVIVRNLGKEEQRFRFTAETNVTWNDIGGLHEAKKQMIEAVELPSKHPELFKHYNKRPIKGVLLYGPPGCGKTMLAKATASALSSTDTPGLIYVKGPEVLDRYVGVAEATVRSLFERARFHKEQHGTPAVVFIDEADAILGKRGSGISSDVERTIVPMFLTEMDGLEDSGALVILATNRSDILDPAIVRDGRIDRKIKIDRPTPESAIDIFNIHLKNVPTQKGCKREAMAELGSNELFAPTRVLYQVRTSTRGVLDFTLGRIVNGAMIASAVDQASSIALHRDLESGKKPLGVGPNDLVQAIDGIEKQVRDLNHADDLAEFVHDFRDDVIGISRLSATL